MRGGKINLGISYERTSDRPEKRVCRCGMNPVGPYWNINHTENLCEDCYLEERSKYILQKE